MTRWGLVSTIKAPLADILRFAAHHLDLGAHRLFLYLDDPDPEVEAILRAHPKIRVRLCDDAYWRAAPNGRPKKHQPRQTYNASQCYAKAQDVTWLAHIDVDEFLWPQDSVAAHLAALPEAIQTARLRPLEQLSDSDTAYKGFIPSGPERDRITARLYPTYGPFLKGGFLSHVAGKLFVRTGMTDIQFRIHNVFQGDDMNPGPAELPPVRLLHHHAPSWEAWQQSLAFRRAKGSYRAELTPNRPREHGGVKMHELFQMLEAEGGAAAIRAFFDEVCADSPDLRARLSAEGLLFHCALDLDAKAARHFPDQAQLFTGSLSKI